MQTPEIEGASSRIFVSFSGKREKENPESRAQRVSPAVDIVSTVGAAKTGTSEKVPVLYGGYCERDEQIPSRAPPVRIATLLQGFVQRLKSRAKRVSRGG